MSQPTSNNDNVDEPPRPPKDVTPAEKFFRHFQSEMTDIKTQITNLSATSTSGSELSDAVDQCLASIARLNQEVKDASSYIPSYDQRTYGDAIKSLGQKLQEERAKIEPRKKFVFKSRGNKDPAGSGNRSMSVAQKNESERSLQDAPSNGSADTNYMKDKTAAAPAEGSHHERSASRTSPNVTIADESNMHILLPISASNSTGSGTLSNLTHCIVDLDHHTPNPNDLDNQRRSLQTMTIKNTTDSLLICGHVTGATHITNLTNSTIVVSTHQLRIHNSHNCSIYTLCTSRPIIEDCTGITFAPLPAYYLAEQDEGKENQWQNVDDFKWLRAEPSPNWKVLPEGKRVSEKVWRDVVPGSPTNGLEEILAAVGISR